MKKYSFLIYLVPFLLLLLLVLTFQGSTDKHAIKMSQPPEKPEISPYTLKDNVSDPVDSESPKEPEMTFTSRIPVYPNSQKMAVDESRDSREAVFYSTTDSMDDVKNWYIEAMGGLTKVNMIDVVDNEGFRTVTVSLPDPPKEIVEIKERFKGAQGLLITITTLEFYTRNQPRPYLPSDDSEINEEDKSKSGDMAESSEEEKESEND